MLRFLLSTFFLAVCWLPLAKHRLPCEGNNNVIIFPAIRGIYLYNSCFFQANDNLQQNIPQFQVRLPQIMGLKESLLHDYGWKVAIDTESVCSVPSILWEIIMLSHLFPGRHSTSHLKNTCHAGVSSYYRSHIVYKSLGIYCHYQPDQVFTEQQCDS